MGILLGSAVGYSAESPEEADIDVRQVSEDMYISMSDPANYTRSDATASVFGPTEEPETNTTQQLENILGPESVDRFERLESATDPRELDGVNSIMREFMFSYALGLIILTFTVADIVAPIAYAISTLVPWLYLSTAFVTVLGVVAVRHTQTLLGEMKYQ